MNWRTIRLILVIAFAVLDAIMAVTLINPVPLAVPTGPSLGLISPSTMTSRSLPTLRLRASTPPHGLTARLANLGLTSVTVRDQGGRLAVQGRLARALHPDEAAAWLPSLLQALGPMPGHDAFATTSSGNTVSAVTNEWIDGLRLEGGDAQASVDVASGLVQASYFWPTLVTEGRSRVLLPAAQVLAGAVTPGTTPVVTLVYAIQPNSMPLEAAPAWEVDSENASPVVVDAINGSMLARGGTR